MSFIAKTRTMLSGFLSDMSEIYACRRVARMGIKESKNSPTVLFWSAGGYAVLLKIEGIIGLALKLRGYNVHYVICDGSYVACARRHDQLGQPVSRWNEACDNCKKSNRRVLDILGLPYSFIGDHIESAAMSDLKKEALDIDYGNYMSISYEGVPLGKNLASAMVRQTRGSSFKDRRELLQEFAFTVLMVASASKNAIAKFSPSRVYMSHGVYADWGPALMMSLNVNIPVISYMGSYLPSHFYFGCVTSPEQAFQSVSEEAWKTLSSCDLNTEDIDRLNSFLDGRYKRRISSDMKGLLREYRGNSHNLIKRYGLKGDRPVWGIMAHINWDSVSDYFPMVYESFDQWLLSTVETVAMRDDVQWLIKIHPSELHDNPESGAQKLIERHFPELPSHIKLIKMDDDISPLDFYNLIDGGVTVYGTGGLELALMGKPVILAGMAHYSGKGFTFDASDEPDYLALLNRVYSILPINEEQITLARKYAYCYFIRKQIPLGPVLKDGWTVDFRQLSRLLPGAAPVFEFICERIMDGKDFIMDESLIANMYNSSGFNN